VSPDLEEVEEAPPLGPLSELGAHPGYPFVPDDLVELEASLLGLSALVLDCLLTTQQRRALAGILECRGGPQMREPSGQRL
jgi:hypothetical protein